MSIYLKQIEQLVALQHHDNEIVDLQVELQEAPKEVEVLEAEYAELDSRRAAVLEKIDYLKAQEKRLDGEIDDDSAKIKKSKNKLMMVGNTKEYHAMMREMDNMEKLNRLREEERAALAEELSRQEAALVAVTEDVNEIAGRLDEKKANLAARVEEAEKRLEDLNAKRSIAEEAVPAPVLRRYEFIRERLTHPVIVPVEDGECHGCHVMIPPQAFIEVQKGHQILSCPNCQRLIYWCEHFEDKVCPA